MVKKKTVKKPVQKKKAKKTVKAKGISQRKPLTPKNKMKFAIKNVVFFLMLGIISYILFSVTGKEIYSNLFELLSMIFIFIAIAFLIVLLILVFMKSFKKR